MIVTNTTTGKTYISQDEFARRTHHGAHWSGGAAIDQFLGEPDTEILHPESASGFVRVFLWDLARVEEVEASAAFLARRTWTSRLPAQMLEQMRWRAVVEISITDGVATTTVDVQPSTTPAEVEVEEPVLPLVAEVVHQTETHRLAVESRSLGTTFTVVLYTATLANGESRYGYRWESSYGVFESTDSDLSLTPSERVGDVLRDAEELRQHLTTGRNDIRELVRKLRALLTLTESMWETLVRIGRMGSQVSAKQPSVKGLIDRGLMTGDLKLTKKGHVALYSADGAGTYLRLSRKN